MDNKNIHRKSDEEEAGPSGIRSDHDKCKMHYSSQDPDLVSQSIENEEETEQIQNSGSTSVKCSKGSKSEHIDLLGKSYKQNQEIKKPARMSSNGMKLMIQDHKKRLLNQNTNPSLENKLIKEKQCRICFESNMRNEFISPCRCTGSIGVVHKSCLETWITITERKSCEICEAKFSVEVTGTSISFIKYLFNEQNRIDLLKFFFDAIIFLCCISVLFLILSVLTSQNDCKAGKNRANKISIPKKDFGASSSIPGVLEKENLTSNSIFPDLLNEETLRLNSTFHDVLKEKELKFNSTLSGLLNNGESSLIVTYFTTENKMIFEICAVLLCGTIMIYFKSRKRYYELSWKDFQKKNSIIGISMNV